VVTAEMPILHFFLSLDQAIAHRCSLVAAILVTARSGSRCAVSRYRLCLSKETLLVPIFYWLFFGWLN
jgi:hypothetical protein